MPSRPPERPLTNTGEAGTERDECGFYARLTDETAKSISYWSDDNQGAGTLGSPKLREWVEQRLADSDRVLTPCAGHNRLSIPGEEVRIDVNPETDPDIIGDFREIGDKLSAESFDAIFYDPPFTLHQAQTKYQMDIDDLYHYDRETMAYLDQFLKAGGTFLQIGYQSTILDREYAVTDFALCNKCGIQNDVLLTAARKPPVTPSAEEARSITATTRMNPAAPGTSRDVSTGGNGGQEIDLRYHRSTVDSLAASLPNSFSSDKLSLHLTPSEGQIVDLNTDLPWPQVTTYTYNSANPHTISDLSNHFADGVFDRMSLS